MFTRFSTLPLIIIVFLTLSICTSIFTSCDRNEKLSDEEILEETTPKKVFIGDDSSEVPLHTTCQECHQDIFENWKGSHHHLANRALDPSIEDQVFANAKPVKEKLSTTRFKKEGDQYQYVTTLPSGEEKVYTADMVLGHYPLFQYLMPKEGGRWQVTDLAYDPEKKEFFSVTGDTEYERDDWLHWTNGANNWNANCAQCHMTHYKKNYDSDADKYQSTWHEMGITCLQCHDNMDTHVKNPSEPLVSLTDRQTMHSCATCHSRRAELTEDFTPGDNYHDHYRLQLPVREGLYYPDGQVRDEVFVYGSFMMSKMGHAGVSCKNCHDPHSNKLILPAQNNMLCMQCHGNGQMGAKIIEPTAHSFHVEGSTGNQCVNCHMTHTTYMERDPRRDHGFHIPDPQLTKEMGIPNACNKCHDDQSTDWAIEWTGKWYGEKMDRPERDRTRVVQQVYNRVLQDYRDLIKQYDLQEIPAWKATLLTLLSSWSGIAEVDKRALEALQADDPLLRSAAIQVLQYNPAFFTELRPLLTDPIRSVRIDAAWALRNEIAPASQAAQELVASLQLREDQPSTSAMFAQWYQAQNDLAKATTLLERAAQLDSREPAYHYELAITYNNRKMPQEARAAFQEALKAGNDSAFLHYQYALFENEQGDRVAARNALLSAVGIDPTYSRAWYNLSLMYSRDQQYRSASNAVDRAMQLEPDNLDYAYAKATILAQMGEIDFALELLQAIIIRDQQYRPAIQLYQNLMIRQRRQNDSKSSE